MLKKLSVIDQIQVLEDGTLQIRKANIITEDDVEIAKTYHRHVLHPGDNLKGEAEKVVAIAKTIWTSELIDAYLAAHPVVKIDKKKDLKHDRKK